MPVNETILFGLLSVLCAAAVLNQWFINRSLMSRLEYLEKMQALFNRKPLQVLPRQRDLPLSPIR